MDRSADWLTDWLVGQKGGEAIFGWLCCERPKNSFFSCTNNSVKRCHITLHHHPDQGWWSFVQIDVDEDGDNGVDDDDNKDDGDDDSVEDDNGVGDDDDSADDDDDRVGQDDDSADDDDDGVGDDNDDDDDANRLPY